MTLLSSPVLREASLKFDVKIHVIKIFTSVDFVNP